MENATSFFLKTTLSKVVEDQLSRAKALNNKIRNYEHKSPEALFTCLREKTFDEVIIQSKTVDRWKC